MDVSAALKGFAKNRLYKFSNTMSPNEKQLPLIFHLKVRSSSYPPAAALS